MTVRRKPRTIAAQALGAIEPETKGVALPIHVSTTFIRDPDNQYRAGYIYGRPDNATVRQTEAVIAALEGAHEAMLFGSGMAAATSVVLALPPGSHVLAPQVCYWGLRDWLKNEAPLFGYRVDLVDMSSLEAVRAAMTPDTKLVWIETPANPLWSITDIAAVAEIAHAGGAAARHRFHRRDAGVHQPARARRRHRDAFGDEVSQRPFRRDRGRAGGRARRTRCGRASSRCARITARSSDRSRHGCCCAGCARSTCACARRRRPPRCSRRASRTTRRFRAVLYPGLPSHPGHAIAARQMSGFGGMLSIRVKGGERAAIDAAARVELWKRATSLGGVESLIEHRASIEGPGSPCPTDLLRLSAGLEDADDLYDDLDRALRAANA